MGKIIITVLPGSESFEGKFTLIKLLWNVFVENSSPIPVDEIQLLNQSYRH